MSDTNYNYEAFASDVNLESITSSGDNALILEKLRDNDGSFKSMNIFRVGDEWDEGDFIVQEGDDLGWLGYFIGKSTRLESLLISHPGNDSFGKGFAQNQSIQSLSIRNDLGKAGFQALAPFLKNTNTLEELKIHGTVYSLECARNIALLLSRCQIKSLKKVAVEDNGLSGEGLEEIACALRAQPQLEELLLSSIDMEVSPFEQRGYVALGNTMKHWTSPALNKLAIKHSDLDDEGLLALLEGMANCVNINHLDLGGNRSITEVGLRALSSLFQSKKFCLQSLDVGEMEIENEGMGTLASGITAFQSLKSLNLSFNNIGDEGLEALAVGISNNKYLESLDLWNSGTFSAIGLRRLSDVIPTVLNLRELNLSGNSINDEGMQALAVGLRRLRALERLNLSYNTIGSEGLRALAAAEISPLRWLKLADNAINDEALGALVEGIENFSGLETLNLSRNRITSSGLEVFAPIFENKRSSLKEIGLDSTNIEDIEARAFAEGLVGNESLEKIIFGCRNVTTLGWSAFSTLLCDTSSINNIYLSNHTLEVIGGFNEAPLSVDRYLQLNRQNEYDIAICKILMSHYNLDMAPFLQWKLKLLPFVLAWFETAQSCRTYLEVDESIESFERRELAAIYQFIRGLPALAASGFCKQMSTAEGSKKRKFDRCDK